MELPSWIDEDIVFNPMYWMLTAAVEIALMIGFKSQSLWNSGLSMPFYSKLLVLLLMPIAAYFVVMKIKR